MDIGVHPELSKDDTRFFFNKFLGAKPAKATVVKRWNPTVPRAGKTPLLLVEFSGLLKLDFAATAEYPVIVIPSTEAIVVVSKTQSDVTEKEAEYSSIFSVYSSDKCVVLFTLLPFSSKMENTILLAKMFPDTFLDANMFDVWDDLFTTRYGSSISDHTKTLKDYDAPESTTYKDAFNLLKASVEAKSVLDPAAFVARMQVINHHGFEHDYLLTAMASDAWGSMFDEIAQDYISSFVLLTYLDSKIFVKTKQKRNTDFLLPFIMKIGNRVPMAMAFMHVSHAQYTTLPLVDYVLTNTTVDVKNALIDFADRHPIKRATLSLMMKSKSPLRFTSAGAMMLMEFLPYDVTESNENSAFSESSIIKFMREASSQADQYAMYSALSLRAVPDQSESVLQRLFGYPASMLDEFSEPVAKDYATVIDYPSRLIGADPPQGEFRFKVLRRYKNIDSRVATLHRLKAFQTLIRDDFDSDSEAIVTFRNAAHRLPSAISDIVEFAKEMKIRFPTQDGDLIASLVMYLYYPLSESLRSDASALIIDESDDPQSHFNFIYSFHYFAGVPWSECAAMASVSRLEQGRAMFMGLMALEGLQTPAFVTAMKRLMEARHVFSDDDTHDVFLLVVPQIKSRTTEKDLNTKVPGSQVDLFEAILWLKGIRDTGKVSAMAIEASNYADDGLLAVLSNSLSSSSSWASIVTVCMQSQTMTKEIALVLLKKITRQIERGMGTSSLKKYVSAAKKLDLDEAKELAQQIVNSATPDEDDDDGYDDDRMDDDQPVSQETDEMMGLEEEEAEIDEELEELEEEQDFLDEEEKNDPDDEDALLDSGYSYFMIIETLRLIYRIQSEYYEKWSREQGGMYLDVFNIIEASDSANSTQHLTEATKIEYPEPLVIVAASQLLTEQTDNTPLSNFIGVNSIHAMTSPEKYGKYMSALMQDESQQLLDSDGIPNTFDEINPLYAMQIYPTMTIRTKDYSAERDYGNAASMLMYADYMEAERKGVTINPEKDAHYMNMYAKLQHHPSRMLPYFETERTGLREELESVSEYETVPNKVPTEAMERLSGTLSLKTAPSDFIHAFGNTLATFFTATRFLQRHAPSYSEILSMNAYRQMLSDAFINSLNNRYTVDENNEIINGVIEQAIKICIRSGDDMTHLLRLFEKEDVQTVDRNDYEMGVDVKTDAEERVEDGSVEFDETDYFLIKRIEFFCKVRAYKFKSFSDEFLKHMKSAYGIRSNPQKPSDVRKKITHLSAFRTSSVTQSYYAVAPSGIDYPEKRTKFSSLNMNEIGTVSNALFVELKTIINSNKRTDNDETITLQPFGSVVYAFQYKVMRALKTEAIALRFAYQIAKYYPGVETAYGIVLDVPTEKKRRDRLTLEALSTILPMFVLPYVPKDDQVIGTVDKKRDVELPDTIDDYITRIGHVEVLKNIAKNLRHAFEQMRVSRLVKRAQMQTHVDAGNAFLKGAIAELFQVLPFRVPFKNPEPANEIIGKARDVVFQCVRRIEELVSHEPVVLGKEVMVQIDKTVEKEILADKTLDIEDLSKATMIVNLLMSCEAEIRQFDEGKGGFEYVLPKKGPMIKELHRLTKDYNEYHLLAQFMGMLSLEQIQQKIKGYKETSV